MTKFLIMIFALVASASTAFAEYPSFGDIEYLMNHSGTQAAKVQLGTQMTSKKLHVMRATYSFVRDGGGIGAITLKDADGQAAKLPTKAIIRQVIIDVLTAPTSGGSATIALTAQSAGDLKAATAIASYTGIIAGVPVGTAATMIKLTAKRTLQATVAVAALTAGKFDVLIEYYLSE